MNKIELTQAISKLIKEILEVEEINYEEKLIEIGFNSIKAIQLEWKITELTNVEIRIESLFLSASIQEIIDQVFNMMSDRNDEKTDFTQEQGKIGDNANQLVSCEASSLQKSIFTASYADSDGINYNMALHIILEGALKIDKIKKIFNILVQRHESLRTSFTISKGTILQNIHTKVEVDFEMIETTQSKEYDVLCNLIRPFDLRKAPLFRVRVLKTAPDRHILFLDTHHIISDGVSSIILWHEFCELYKGSTLPELKVQYRDYTKCHNELLASSKGIRLKNFWLDELKNCPKSLELKTDYPRPSTQSFIGSNYYFEISDTTYAKISELIHTKGVTLYMFLLSAFSVLLSKYTTKEDIVIGTPIAGRTQKTWNDVVGMFVNTLAIRTYPQKDITFAELLNKIKFQSLMAYDNQEYPFSELVENMGIDWDMGHNPLFDVMFSLQNMDDYNEYLPDLKFKVHENSIGKTSRFDLTLIATLENDKLYLIFEYCTKLFRLETIELMSRHFMQILETVLNDVNIRLDDIDMMSVVEKTEVLNFCGSSSSVSCKKTIHELYEEQVQKTPDNIAVKFNESTLTYRELNEKANQLARLLRLKGIQPDDKVGLMINRSIEMMVGVFAILKAGGAYVPLDPSYPIKRIQHILQDSEAKILLISENKKHISNYYHREIINVMDSCNYEQENSNLPNVINSNNIAYILYTSGSTGLPKGTIVEHRNVVNVIDNIKKIAQGCSEDIWTMSMSICFDFAAWEFYGALTSGAKLIIVAENILNEGKDFYNLLVEEQITMFTQTPAYFYVIAKEDSKRLYANLRLKKIMLGGEKIIPKNLLAFHDRYPDIELYNLYGPTETTIVSTSKKFERTDLCQSVSNIGRPLENYRTYILDEQRRLLPVGVCGELCIGGMGVARGYLNRPELTKNKFISNPFVTGEKLYCTGDLVRWLPDGNIEYLDRYDYQVKIRGYRIELGEIESILMQHDSIRKVLVLAKDDKDGTQYLSCYLVTENELSTDEIKRFLLEKLPKYMVPSFFIRLDDFPLTTNGKVDRKALLDILEVNDTADVHQLPQTETELKLTEIWKNLLNLDTISLDANFFNIGGQSLKLMNMIADIEDELGVELRFVDIFDIMTIRKLAQHINEKISDSMEL